MNPYWGSLQCGHPMLVIVATILMGSVIGISTLGTALIVGVKSVVSTEVGALTQNSSAPKMGGDPEQ